MEFIAGVVIGGLICAMVVYAYQKGKSEKETSESYTRGYKDGRKIEQRAILDYINLLNSKSDTCVSDDELPEGSEK